MGYDLTSMNTAKDLLVQHIYREQSKFWEEEVSFNVNILEFKDLRLQAVLYKRFRLQEYPEVVKLSVKETRNKPF